MNGGFVIAYIVWAFITWTGVTSLNRIIKGEPEFDKRTWGADKFADSDRAIRLIRLTYRWGFVFIWVAASVIFAIGTRDALRCAWGELPLERCIGL